MSWIDPKMRGTYRGQPQLDPAYAVELSERERVALMTVGDWGWMIDRYFDAEFGEPLDDDLEVSHNA